MDKRKHDRQPTEIETVYSVKSGNVHTGKIKDFSQGGLFLQYADPSQYIQLKHAAIRIRDSMEVVVSYSGQETHIIGRIARYNDVGIGVQFSEKHAQFYELLGLINQQQEQAICSARKQFIDNQKAISHREKETILKSFLSHGREFIVQRYNEFFDVLDETLLVDADKQRSDEEQHPFFDAMALLTKHRKNIIESIEAESKIALDHVAAGKAECEAEKILNPELSVQQLSLVEKEDFEDWLIVRVVVSRADLQFKEPLLALQLRLDAAFPVSSSGSTQNPFSPSSISCSLHRCIRHLRFEQKIERVIFKVFQERVIDKLGSLYKNLNQVLINNAVLPDIDIHSYLATEAFKKRKAAGATIESPTNESPTKSKLDGEKISEGLQGTDLKTNHTSQQKVSNNPSLSGADASTSNAQQEQMPISKNDESVSESASSDTPVARLKESLTKARSAYSTASRLMRLHRKLNTGDETKGEASGSAATAGDAASAGSGVAVGADVNVGAPAFTNENTSQEMDGNASVREISKFDNAAQELTSDRVDDFVSDVSAIQRKLANAEIEFTGEEPLLEFVESNIKNSHSSITGSEREVIEMLDALFTNIVDNQRVAPKLRQTLRRLEVPVLKVMLQDPSLFQAEKHPARQLINSLALLSDKDSVNLANNLKTIENTVSDVLANYETDIDAFEKAQDNIKHELERENRVIQRNLERVTEACRGQEKVNQANYRIDSEINKRLGELKVPLAVVNLISAGWRELMRLCIIREGVDSRAWATTLLVLDQLVLRLSPGKFDQDMVKFTNEELLKLIEKGLSKIPHNKFNQKEVVSELARLLNTEDINDSEYVFYHPEADESEDPLVQLKCMGAEGSEQSLNRWLKRVQQLTEGQWLEFDAQSEYSHLYQLAWKGENGRRYVFVNHHGMKVHDIPLAEIAYQLRKGDIRVLNEQSFAAVDRGLDALVQKIYDQLAFEAAHDQLTGLVTRKEFERCLARSVARSKKDHKQYLFCYFDLQEFKVINNTCGYEAGDTLLKNLAKKLVSETDPEDVLARIGADQFALLSVVKNDSEGYRKANKLKQIIEGERFEWNSEKFVISCIGSLVVFDETNDHVLELLRGVESACVIAKKAGHKELQVYDPNDDRVEERDNIMSWVARINKALDNDQLKLRCQKIAPVDGAENRKPHFEILLTVVDENGEHLPPTDFISAAEEYSRMSSVDRWVIGKVLDWMTENKAFLDFVGGFSINLSGHSMNDDSFLDYIFDKLVKTKVPRDKVIFEVTETTAVANLDDAADFIQEMREIGCRFSLDDFGAGQASYAYLKHLPVDFIKIDGCFVRNIANDDVDYAMVKSITDMGHFLEKFIVAEFVSDQEIFDTVADIGVDYVQGYHMGTPVFLEDLIESEASNSH